ILMFKWLENFINFWSAKKHVRIGLALGSGGAKGFALIGALKAFEEEGIEFDVVAGTSIGSIVGAMYACGYSWSEMFSFLWEFNVLSPSNLVALTLKRATVASILDGMLGGKHFEETLLPFAAIATDINKGEEVVMKHGSLATALAASSAIPPIFKPVERNGVKLVDGAYVNSVPSDVVKEMGADVVIGVSLSDTDFNTGIKIALDNAYKGNKVPICNRLKAGRENSDILIEPDLSAYKSTSVGAANEMYSIGYEATKNAMPMIKKTLKEKGVKYL
ncbi:MAG: patatin-like phospholipase family protein, partial [Clostridia bacterium]|nr:patatin-like phospholipase family protein [Clostridia bacterium]